MQRAVNTDKDVIKVGDLYYMCFQGVWFMSTTPSGPWEVTGDVPKADLRDSGQLAVPQRHLRHRRGVDDDDDWVIRDGRGYTGVMIALGLRGVGHGLLLPAVLRAMAAYPYYYPHYPTYGYGASYNPWTGAYARRGRRTARTAAQARRALQPADGHVLARRRGVGPGGARGAAQAYNPRTGAYGANPAGLERLRQLGQHAVQRGDQWASTSRVTNNRTGTTTRAHSGSGGGSAVTRTGGAGGNGGAVKTGSGDMYAGRDGNVYKQHGRRLAEVRRQRKLEQRPAADRRAEAAGPGPRVAGG